MLSDQMISIRNDYKNIDRLIISLEKLFYGLSNSSINVSENKDSIINYEEFGVDRKCKIRFHI